MNRKFPQIFLMLIFTFIFSEITPIQAQEMREVSVLSKKKKYFLSVCAIFRDEARFLKEWIEFHRLLGVEHFYLFNNLSSDDYKTVLAPYIRKNIVELYEWNHEATEINSWNFIQTSAYQMIIEKSAKETEWLAILDTDEFLYPVKDKDLRQFLNKFQKYSAICVNWQMFGTSGVDFVPSNELLIDLLTLKAPQNHYENFHVKSIVKPSHVSSCLNPHFCFFYSGCYQVNENKEQFEGPISPYVSVDKIRINHYWARDEDFLYNVKIPRRGLWGEGPDGCIMRNESLNIESDFEISRFSDALRKRMFK